MENRIFEWQKMETGKCEKKSMHCSRLHDTDTLEDDEKRSFIQTEKENQKTRSFFSSSVNTNEITANEYSIKRFYLPIVLICMSYFWALIDFHMIFCFILFPFFIKYFLYDIIEFPIFSNLLLSCSDINKTIKEKQKMKQYLYFNLI